MTDCKERKNRIVNRDYDLAVLLLDLATASFN